MAIQCSKWKHPLDLNLSKRLFPDLIMFLISNYKQEIKVPWSSLVAQWIQVAAVGSAHDPATSTCHGHSQKEKRKLWCPKCPDFIPFPSQGFSFHCEWEGKRTKRPPAPLPKLLDQMTYTVGLHPRDLLYNQKTWNISITHNKRMTHLLCKKTKS